MRKIAVFISFVLLVAGLVFAEEGETAPRETKVKSRTINELTMHQAILAKIRAQSKITQAIDLSQMIKESENKETEETDDTHHRDYDAEVQKIFESLY